MGFDGFIAAIPQRMADHSVKLWLAKKLS